jgi:hypothetical protein
MIPWESRKEARYLQDLPSRWDFCRSHLRAQSAKRNRGDYSPEIRCAKVPSHPERDTCSGTPLVFPGEPCYAVTGCESFVVADSFLWNG